MAMHDADSAADLRDARDLGHLPPEAPAGAAATSPLATGLVMLAVYVAMYLTVAGVIRVLDWVRP